MENNNLKGKLILITDDDFACYLYIKAVLEKTGASFHWAQNGLSAVEYIKSNSNVALVFMDINMPVMNGKDAIQHIQKINNNIPIIIQSCINETEYTGNLNQTNLEFLQKPFKSTDIYSAISKVFSKS